MEWIETVWVPRSWFYSRGDHWYEWSAVRFGVVTWLKTGNLSRIGRTYFTSRTTWVGIKLGFDRQGLRDETNHKDHIAIVDISRHGVRYFIHDYYSDLSISPSKYQPYMDSLINWAFEYRSYFVLRASRIHRKSQAWLWSQTLVVCQVHCNPFFHITKLQAWNIVVDDGFD
jgi:hypothetical protein